MANNGVQFEAVQISVNSPCNPVIFKGTNRSDYAHTAFLMPRLKLAKSSRGNDAIEFLKMSSGEHLLQLGLHFPKFSIRNKQIHHSGFSKKECDYHQILNAINYQVDPQDRVTKIVTLQMKNIGVQINGIDEVYWAANRDKDQVDTSILNYEGQIKNIEIPLTYGQVEDTITRLTYGLGLNIKVYFEFLARRSNGYHEINISVSSVASEVQSLLQAQANIPLKEMLLDSVQIEGALSTAVANSAYKSSSRYYSEDGSNEKFQEIGRDLYKQVMRSIIGKGYKPSNEDSGDATTNNDHETDWEYYERLRNAQQHQDEEVVDDGQEPIDNLPIKSQSGKKISAQLVINTLKEQRDYKVQMENNSSLQVETYATSILVKKDVDEKNREKLDLISGQNSLFSGFTLQKDDELTIFPQRKESQELEYQEVKTYYDLNNIADKSNSSPFPIKDLISTGKLKQETILETPIARFEKSMTYFVKSPVSLAPIPVIQKLQYKWGEIQRYEKKQVAQVKNFDDPDMGVDELMKHFKVGVIFNKKSPNRVYPLEKLLQNEVSFVSSHYDHETGGFTLKANEDLGAIRLKNLESVQTQSMIMKQYFQEFKIKHIFESFSRKKATISYKGGVSKFMPMSEKKIVIKLDKYTSPASIEGEVITDIPVKIFNESGSEDSPLKTD